MTTQHTICVQFKISRTALGLGTIHELDWRHARESELDDLLTKHGLGMCDGGQSGMGSMEIFLEDVTDLARAVAVVTDYLTDNEWLPFCKIASLTHPITDDSRWDIHYPKNAEFSPMEWV